MKFGRWISTFQWNIGTHLPDYMMPYLFTYLFINLFIIHSLYLFMLYLMILLVSQTYSFEWLDY